MLFPPLPLPVTNARFPGAREFLSFSENAFGLVFLGIDVLHLPSDPIRTPSLAVLLYFLFTVFLCVRASWAAHFGCIIYRVN